MPNFNKSAAKFGNEVVERGAGGGTRNFKPWLPKIFWRGADDEHFILILNTLEDIVRVQYHPFIETDDGIFSVLARTDPGIGERADPMQEVWKYEPRLFDVMIAVELEPIFESRVVNGRERQSIAGFEVATRTFESRIRDDNGELTDDKEEVTVPAIGCITQSPYNFGNQLNAYDNNDNPIHLTPFRITQVGKGSGVTYSFQGFPDTEFDLTNLYEFIGNISYLQVDDRATELFALLDGVSDEEMPIIIGRYLLDLKLEELADRETYDDVFKRITKPSRFANQKPEPKSKTTGASKTPRVKAPVASHDEDSDDTEVHEEKPVATPSKGRAVRNSAPSAQEKLAEIRASRAAKAAAKEAVAA